MYGFLETPSVLKIGEHGTPYRFVPLSHNDGAADEDEMDGKMTSLFRRRPIPAYFNPASKFQSVSAMNEYKTKSAEELRYEDYLLNRKGNE
jgi:hypothetical protein